MRAREEKRREEKRREEKRERKAKNKGNFSCPASFFIFFSCANRCAFQ